MGSTKALLLATSVVMGAVASATAADLLPPPPMPPPIIAPLDTSGWYIRADVGVGITRQDNLRSTINPTVVVPGFQVNSHEIADAAIIGAGFGYQFNNWFRGDVTGEYRTRVSTRAIESYDGSSFGLCGAGGRCYDSYTGSIASAVFLANGYVDLGTWYGLTPFLGAGVGFAHHLVGSTVDQGVGVVAGNGGGFSADSHQTNFAWAAHAGLGYTVSPNLKLEFSYRYLDMGRINGQAINCQPAGAGCTNEQQSYKLTSNDFRVGMRWMLGGGDSYVQPAPAFYAPPPPGPLVRKY